MTAFCTNCGCKRPYTVDSSEQVLSVHGVMFECLETVARCSVCWGMVYVPEINDANARAREEAFEAAAKRKREEDGFDWKKNGE